MSRHVPYLAEEAIERDAAALLAEFEHARVIVLEPPIPVEDITEGRSAGRDLAVVDHVFCPRAPILGLPLCRERLALANAAPEYLGPPLALVLPKAGHESPAARDLRVIGYAKIPRSGAENRVFHRVTPKKTRKRSDQ